MEISPPPLLYSFEKGNLDHFIRNSIILVFGQLQLLLRYNLLLLPYKFDLKSSFDQPTFFSSKVFLTYKFLKVSFNLIALHFFILPSNSFLDTPLFYSIQAFLISCTISEGIQVSSFRMTFYFSVQSY